MQKLQELAVIIKIDGKVYPVALTDDEVGYVIALLQRLHDGRIKCLSTPIEGLEIGKKKA